VLDVVHSAVALPQSDPQDRLRVLRAAANVVGPIDAKLAQQYTKEGTAIETKLVAEGQTPAVTTLDGGNIDCASAANFVQTLPPSAVVEAQQALVGAIVNCPKQVNPAAAAKLEAALTQGVVAGRPLLALMNSQGMTSQWSQDIFTRMFASLPDDASVAKEAPNYASMYMQVAGQVDPESAKSAGKSFMYWLAKLPQSPERSMATTITASALNQTLGTDAYQELLRSDPTLQQLVNGADPNAVLSTPDDESASVQQAGEAKGELGAQPPSLRARNAAASGYMSGTSGDRKQAEQYFDIAFGALDEVWSERASSKVNAADIVQEVSEAAAQVDTVEALQRAQKLQDPSAQAIGMLAVARVIAGQP
jgi:hypothetical protein